MKSISLVTVLAFAAGIKAQSAPAATMTITATPGCPSAPAADVMVTRSNAPVPSCEADSNATKPSIVSMSTATGSGQPVQFTGAAGSVGGQRGVWAVMGGVAGVAAWML